MNDAIHINRILVPIDGSEFSCHAAKHAVRIAQAYASEVIFLHVVDDQIVAHLAHGESLESAARIHDRLVEQGRVYLHDVARLAEAQALVHQELVADGDPCGVICDTGARYRVNLIVMGKVGRRGARRLVVGSVTRRVIEFTELPILIITAPPHSADTGSDDATKSPG